MEEVSAWWICNSHGRDTTYERRAIWESGKKMDDSNPFEKVERWWTSCKNKNNENAKKYSNPFRVNQQELVLQISHQWIEHQPPTFNQWLATVRAIVSYHIHCWGPHIPVEDGRSLICRRYQIIFFSFLFYFDSKKEKSSIIWLIPYSLLSWSLEPKN